MAGHKHNRLYLAILAGIASLNVHAVGLGEIAVRSGLNQPLHAEIPMIKLSPENAGQARVVIRATENTATGSTNSSIVARLNGEFVAQGGGLYTLKITSRDNIREPVLSFYVEVILPDAHSRREFNVLLDPPAAALPPMIAAGTDTAAPHDFAAMERSIEALSAAPGSRREKSLRPPPAAATEKSVTAAATEPVQPDAAPERKTGSLVDGNYGPVMSGETLWAIAQRVRPDRSISIPEMMNQLLAVNPDAFVNNDINRLKAGVTLRMPVEPVASVAASTPTPQSPADTTTAPQAQSTVAAAAEPAIVAVTPAADADVPAIGSVATPASPSSTTEVPVGVDAAANSTDNDTAELSARVDGLLAHVTELQTLVDERNTRVTALETELEQMRDRLAALPALDAPAAATVVISGQASEAETPAVIATPPLSATEDLNPKITLPTTSGTEPATTTVAAADTATQSESPVPLATAPADPQTVDTAASAPDAAVDAPVVAVASSSPTAGWLTWLMGGAALTLFAGALSFTRRRRKAVEPTGVNTDWEARKQQDARRLAEVARKAQERSGASAGAPESIVAEEDPAPSWTIDNADTPIAESWNSAKVVPLKVDASRFEPLFKEVDLQLAYLQYEDAEKLVLGKLKEHPEETALLVKLAEVHATAGNVEKFVELAELLSKVPGFRDSDEWNRIAKLGESTAPTHPLFEYLATVELTRDQYGNLVRA